MRKKQKVKVQNKLGGTHNVNYNKYGDHNIRKSYFVNK